MNQSQIFPSMPKSILPSFLALWTFIVLGAAIGMSPIVQATPLSWDDQIFEPGGMMLIESLRLHRHSLLLGVRHSLMLMTVITLVILLARARMTAAIVDLAQGKAPRPELFSRAPAYLGVTVIKLIFLGICGALLSLTYRVLPPTEGTLPPRLIFLYGIVGVLALLALGFIVVFSDVYRIAIFHELAPLSQLKTAWATTLGSALPLLSLRAIWTLVGLGTGYLTLLCASQPMTSGSVGAVATFLFSQCLVLMNLVMEAWWLSQAEKKLLLYAP